MQTPGERLRAERIRLGFNQADFGAIGGVRKQAQIKYEKGERRPDASYFAAIAEAGVDVGYVLTGETAAQRAVLDAIRGSTADALKINGAHAEQAAIRDADAMRKLAALNALDPSEAELLRDFRKCGSDDRAAIRKFAAVLAAGTQPPPAEVSRTAGAVKRERPGKKNAPKAR